MEDANDPNVPELCNHWMADSNFLPYLDVACFIAGCRWALSLHPMDGASLGRRAKWLWKFLLHCYALAQTYSDDSGDEGFDPSNAVGAREDAPDDGFSGGAFGTSVNGNHNRDHPAIRHSVRGARLGNILCVARAVLEDRAHFGDVVLTPASVPIGIRTLQLCSEKLALWIARCNVTPGDPRITDPVLQRVVRMWGSLYALAETPRPREDLRIVEADWATRMDARALLQETDEVIRRWLVELEQLALERPRLHSDHHRGLGI